MIGEFTANGKQVQARAFELSGLAEHLREMIQRFKLNSESVCPDSDALMGNCMPPSGRPFIQWNDGLSVGVIEMDEQHNRFLSFLNELHPAMKKGMGEQAIGKILSNLAQYTDYHFKAEEDLLEKQVYPQLEVQKEAHRRFIEKVAEFRTRYRGGDNTVVFEALTTIRDWLINHIQKMDRKYGPRVR